MYLPSRALLGKKAEPIKDSLGLPSCAWAALGMVPQEPGSPRAGKITAAEME